MFVKVCSKTGREYRRAGHVWPPQWIDAEVDDETLALLERDPHLSVKRLNPFVSAKQALEHAKAALEVAIAAKLRADDELKAAEDKVLACEEFLESHSAEIAEQESEPTPLTDAYELFASADAFKG